MPKFDKSQWNHRGQPKLPELMMELSEMGLAGNQNIFKMVRQILYEQFIRTPARWLTLQVPGHPKTPALGWFEQQNKGYQDHSCSTVPGLGREEPFSVGVF